MTDTILNSKDYGLAQNRPRLWLVAIRRDSYHRKVKWPEGVPGVSLESVLLPKTTVEKRRALDHPKGSATVLNNIQEGLKKLREEPVGWDIDHADGVG